MAETEVKLKRRVIFVAGHNCMRGGCELGYDCPCEALNGAIYYEDDLPVCLHVGCDCVFQFTCEMIPVHPGPRMRAELVPVDNEDSA